MGLQIKTNYKFEIIYYLIEDFILINLLQIKVKKCKLKRCYLIKPYIACIHFDL